MRAHPDSPVRRGRARAGTTCETRLPTAPCRACAELDPVTACDTCISQAAAMFSAGNTAAAIARALAVNEPRAVYLVAIAHDREERAALTADTIATAGLRALVAAATGFGRWAERPGPARPDIPQIPEDTVAALCERLRGRGSVTTGEIMQAAGYRSLTTLKRDLGILKQPARHNTHEPRYNDTLDIDAAARIVRALGISPCEVPWL